MVILKAKFKAEVITILLSIMNIKKKTYVSVKI